LFKVKIRNRSVNPSDMHKLNSATNVNPALRDKGEGWDKVTDEGKCN